MTDSKAAKRYSRALFALALASQAVDAIEQELTTVAEAVQQTPEFLMVMLQPQISSDTKKTIVLRAFGQHVSPTVADFLSLLVDRNRVALIGAIMSHFVEQANAWRNETVASVTTAIPLSDTEQQMFIDRLGQVTGKKVELVTQVDPSIIGGARVYVGGKMIDGTVTTHLERIRERLKQVRVV